MFNIGKMLYYYTLTNPHTKNSENPPAEDTYYYQISGYAKIRNASIEIFTILSIAAIYIYMRNLIYNKKESNDSITANNKGRVRSRVLHKLLFDSRNFTADGKNNSQNEIV